METYYITGIQLGMLIEYKNKSEREHLINDIIDKQQVTNEVRKLADKTSRKRLGK